MAAQDSRIPTDGAVSFTGHRVLVAGWFSFDEGHATAGDLLARDLVCDWLAQAGRAFDVAYVPPFDGTVDWRSVDPAGYSDVVFVCGPFAPRPEVELPFLARFGGSRHIGVNLTMRAPLDQWNPFDVLLERDSSRQANPDVTFLSAEARAPLVGVCLLEDHPGYQTAVAKGAIDRLLSEIEAAVVTIDTRLDVNSAGLRTPREVESLIARMDVIVSTRLHGLVLGLKHGVPVVAIDTFPGGAKVKRQAEAVGWPAILTVDVLDAATLRGAFDFCRTDEARARARSCAAAARARVEEIRDAFVAALRDGPGSAARYGA